MFLKRKAVPSATKGDGPADQPGTGGAGAGAGAGAISNLPTSPTSPASPPGYPHVVPTLHPPPRSPAAAQSANLMPPPRLPKHGRSASQPFPSVPVGTDGGPAREGSTKPKEIKGGKGATSKLGFFSSSLPKAITKAVAPGSAPSTDPDLINGRCATCDSTVRWPRHLDTFRCTVCMMVNDLQYGTLKETPAPLGQPPNLNAQRLPRRVLPISVDRTKSLISQCTRAHLRHVLEQVKTKAPDAQRPAAIESTGNEATSADRTQPHHNPFLNATATTRLNPRSASREPPKRSQDDEHDARRGKSFDEGGRPRTAPGQPRMSEDIAPLQPRYIYRQLENYILSLFENCDSLNCSFLIARPLPPVRAASETALHHGHHESHSKRPDHPESNDGYLGELDPKMLLLGDIGENARYWLGDGSDHQEAISQEPGPALAKERPPNYRKDSGTGPEKRHTRFNWKAVWDWYQSILLCGRSWRLIRSSFDDDERSMLEDPRLERDIEHALAEGRHHVQRTLLKATENLLKHPGRPVKRPEDVRFLLILLANPLLHPQHSHHGNAWSPPQQQPPPDTSKFPDTLPADQAARNFEHARSAAEAASKGSATGHHSGIIKRLMGLVGNTSNECHAAMIQWLHRMPVPQLRDLVDLVSGFVSYRLTRNAGRTRASSHDPTNGLIPVLLGPSSGHTAHLHAAIGSSSTSVPGPKGKDKDKPKENSYADDWQVKVAAKTMSLLFFANFGHVRGRQQLGDDSAAASPHGKNRAVRPGQALPLSEYYNVLLDDADLITDFEMWELKRNKFSFCQYPMFLSIGAKIRLMEHDARRQMQDKARTAFFDSIMTRKVVNQYFILHVRRDCLVEDSLKEISKSVGGGEEEIKKGLKIEFEGEEGIDIGGLRKEWFLLLVREAFDPRHGLFVYDQDSQYCYFNPHTFETSEQYYLVGVVLGLAIYNSTILDISLPPFLFRKLLAAAPTWVGPTISAPRTHMTYTLDDLAEWRPDLARGLRQLLEFEGDVQETFCRDFVIDVERYGVTTQVPLVHGGHSRPVTNSNRREFVDLYVRYILDTSVSRQFEPFKRGFFTVCSGNALALFRPEEIELLVRGSDEALDVDSLQAVALYENWDWARYGADTLPGIDKIRAATSAGKATAVPADVADAVPCIRWFWETLREASARDQRRLLGFVTGSDRIPAMGATSLVVKVACLGADSRRFPIARTCFNTLGLYEYTSKAQLEHRLWMAVGGSEGFGLK